MSNQLQNLFPYCCKELNQSKQKQFESLVNGRVSDTLQAHSLLRRLGQVDNLNTLEMAKYLVKSYINKIFILPNIGKLPQVYDLTEQTEDDDIYVPTFSIGTDFEIALGYIGRRSDLLEKTLIASINYLIDMEDNCLFRLLISSSTFSLTEKTLNPITAQKFSMTLIKDIIKDFNRRNKILKYIVISEQDRLDLAVELEQLHMTTSNTWNLDVNVGKKKYPISLITHKELGGTGKYNINSFDTDYNHLSNFKKFNGIFKVGSEGNFQDYKPKHLNRLYLDDKDTLCNKPGEIQIYALSSKIPIHVPVKQQFTFYPDPNLFKQQKFGYYGWEEIGLMLEHTDDIQMVVIDRSQT